VAQGVDPELKPQYRKKQTKKTVAPKQKNFKKFKKDGLSKFGSLSYLGG
jgi:hypothetical protein